MGFICNLKAFFAAFTSDSLDYSDILSAWQTYPV
jgi:hypothetical protein